jgi:hypothetical protein
MAVNEDLLKPRPGPVDPNKCVTCAMLRGFVTVSTRTDDAELALTTLQAMRVHRTHGQPDDPSNHPTPVR